LVPVDLADALGPPVDQLALGAVKLCTGVAGDLWTRLKLGEGANSQQKKEQEPHVETGVRQLS
jgi:hypothetical protein